MRFLILTILFSFLGNGAHATIFGEDDRSSTTINSSKLSAMEAKASNAVAVMIKKERLADFMSVEEKSNLCPEQRFAKQNSIGECSAFLVAPDLMMTAGHCLFIEDYNHNNICDKVTFAFDYEDGVSNITDTVECESVVDVLYDPEEGGDYAILKLKKTVEHRPYLKLKTSSTIGSEVFSIGTPLGMPKKIARNGFVKTSRSRELEYDLDLFGGNSGSPIIEKSSGKVIGVHVYGGAFALNKDKDRTCQVYDRSCPEGYYCQLSGAFPISAMRQYVLRKLKLTSQN